MTRGVRLLVFALLAGALPCVRAQTISEFPHELVGDIDEENFPEPSGICFHAGRGTLFVVGDEGDIGELATDGRLLRRRRLGRLDFEGITCDPDSGLLYIAVEGAERILQVDPETLSVAREFQLPREFEGRTVMAAGKQGIEAITFVPDAKHPEGGVFLIANQSNKKRADGDDISAVFRVELPIRSADGQVRIIGCIKPGVPDLAALYYDRGTRHFFVLSDSEDLLLEFDGSDQRVAAYRMPGVDQEGFTADSDGFAYIAQDSGGILKLRWRREP